MSMHEYLHENLGIEPLPLIGGVSESEVALFGLSAVELTDFGNHETLDEYLGAPEPLTDVEPSP